MQHKMLMKKREEALTKYLPKKVIFDDYLLEEMFERIKEFFELIAFVRDCDGCDESAAIKTIKEVVEKDIESRMLL